MYEEVWNRFLVRARPAGRGGQARARCCSSSRRGSPSAGPTSSTCSRWPSGASRCGSASSSATRPGSTATTTTRRWTSCASTSCRSSAWTCRRATSRRSRRCVAATADLAVVRFHGHSDKWTSKDIHEKFGYHYSERELKDWAPKLRELADEAERDPRAHEQLLLRLRPAQRPAAHGPPRRRDAEPRDRPGSLGSCRALALSLSPRTSTLSDLVCCSVSCAAETRGLRGSRQVDLSRACDEDRLVARGYRGVPHRPHAAPDRSVRHSGEVARCHPGRAAPAGHGARPGGGNQRVRLRPDGPRWGPPGQPSMVGRRYELAGLR